MLTYIFKRILLFIPTLFVITLLGFIISVNAPGNPVERMVSAAESGGEVSSQTKNQEEQTKFWTKKLGLDLPVFYVSLTSLAHPDTLHKVYDRNEREALDRLIYQYGNWPEIQAYYSCVNAFEKLPFRAAADSIISKGTDADKNKIIDAINAIKAGAVNLKASYDAAVIENQLQTISHLLMAYPSFSDARQAFTKVRANYRSVITNATPWKNYIPKLIFHPYNQYHRWLFGDGGTYSRGLLHGDFGTSYVTKQPISDVIFSKLGWTLLFSCLSVILAYLVSIPVGVNAAAKKGSRSDKTSSLILFILYSIPSFWLATLLLMTFANPDVLHWFPASGVKPVTGYAGGAGFWDKVKASAPYIVLPAICYTYSSFAFLSRTMRVSMLEALGQDYIRTARAKGLTDTQVNWKHAFRNALFPIITVFGSVFPAVISGSVILETIFTIPGMGSEAINAIQDNNYPMIIAVLTITSVLTLIGFLISDILYAVVDPRISYK
jgi:peptide/nickel transport system permease protein